MNSGGVQAQAGEPSSGGMGPRAWCCGHAACTVLLSLLVILTAVSYRSDSATHWVLKQSGKIEVRVRIT